MSLDDFKQGVEELYQGEVMGEVIFNRLLACHDDPVQRYKIATLLQLETETKARLRPVVMSLGLDPVELEASRQAGQEMAAGLEGLGWDDLMAQIRDAVEPFVVRYREIEATAPPEYREAARSMVVHEQALFRFAELEASGDASGSLDDIIVQLNHPLPRPL